MLLGFPSIWFPLSILRETPRKAGEPTQPSELGMILRSSWVFLCQTVFPRQRKNHRPNSQPLCAEPSQLAESCAGCEHPFVYLSPTSSPGGRIIVIQTQESQRVSKSAQALRDRAGIPTQGSSPARVVGVLGLHPGWGPEPGPCAWTCPGWKENTLFILEHLDPKLLLCSVCKAVFNFFPFHCGRRLPIQETIKFGFKCQLMH